MHGDILSRACSESPSSPSRPWGLIIYSGEAKPGNKLKSASYRALQNVRMNFVDVGARALAIEDTWLTIVSAASVDVE
eukprot:4953485-Pyramimonas_sp.AAC.1